MSRGKGNGGGISDNSDYRVCGAATTRTAGKVGPTAVRLCKAPFPSPAAWCSFIVRPHPHSPRPKAIEPRSPSSQLRPELPWCLGDLVVKEKVDHQDIKAPRKPRKLTKQAGRSRKMLTMPPQSRVVVNTRPYQARQITTSHGAYGTPLPFRKGANFRSASRISSVSQSLRNATAWAVMPVSLLMSF